MSAMTEVKRSTIRRALEPHIIPMDDHYPRDPRNRYRIYRLRRGRRGEVYRDILGTTDSAGGIGLAIVQWHEEGEIGPDDAIGVLDCQGRGENPLGADGCYSRPGCWIVNPYARGGR